VLVGVWEFTDISVTSTRVREKSPISWLLRSPTGLFSDNRYYFFEVLSIMMQLWSNPSSFPLEHVAPGPVPAVAFTSVESSAMCGVKVPITHCQCDKALHVGSW